MSPKLIKCSSESSIEEEFDDIEDILDKLMNGVCSSFQRPKRNIYKYVKVLHNEHIIYVIMNMIYYIFSKYNLIKYKKTYRVKGIFCMIDKRLYKFQSTMIIVFDNYFQLNRKIKIPYEYVRTINYEKKYLILNLIPNERNITKIYVETKYNELIFNKIYSNMQYHVKYHQLNQNAIKYYQKFHTKPLVVY